MTRLVPSALACLSALLALVFIPGHAGAETLAEIEDYPADELQVMGFELPRPATVEIEAVGARHRGKDDLVVYAWILDGATRGTLWSQQNSRLERVGSSRVLRRSRDTLELPAGKYELYVWAGTRTPMRWDFGDGLFGRHGIIITHGPSDRDSRELERSLRDCFVRVQAASLGANEVTTFEPTGDLPGALFRATRLGDDASVQAAFRLDRDGDLRLYCVSEIPDRADAFADGAWIVDTATRERVWELARRRTRQAGGADKNRLFDDTVHLPAGHYLVVAGTDGSHAWGDWNGAPPDDPLNWGITILPGKEFDFGAFHLDPAWTRDGRCCGAAPARRRVGRAGFPTQRDADLHIYAVGEHGSDSDEFADYGWIREARRQDGVGDDRAQHPARGRRQKNRLFDGIVQLPAGDYVAYFVTDDSHSYDEWNTDAPFDEDAWGLALYATPSLPPGGFALLEESHGGHARGEAGRGATLANLTEVGDDEDVRAEFTIDQPGRIHVYALGEGLEREMYDYGWIENAATGKTVWEMTMRNTRHAGGARKNRVFDDEVQLDAGRYVVHFQTDGSHAYGDWNDRRPPDPHGWGITVSMTK